MTVASAAHQSRTNRTHAEQSPTKTWNMRLQLFVWLGQHLNLFPSRSSQAFWELWLFLVLLLLPATKKITPHPLCSLLSLGTLTTCTWSQRYIHWGMWNISPMEESRMVFWLWSDSPWSPDRASENTIDKASAKCWSRSTKIITSSRRMKTFSGYYPITDTRILPFSERRQLK